MKPSRIPQMRKGIPLRKTPPGGSDAAPRAIPRNAVVLVNDDHPGTLDNRRVRLLAFLTSACIAIVAGLITVDPFHLVHYTKWPTRHQAVATASPSTAHAPHATALAATRNGSAPTPPAAASPHVPPTAPHVGYAAPPHPTAATAHPRATALPPVAATTWLGLVKQAHAEGIPLEYRDAHLNLQDRHALALTDTGRQPAHPVASVDVISDAGVRWLEDHGLAAGWCPDPSFDDHHFTLWRAGANEGDDGELHLLQCPVP